MKDYFFVFFNRKEKGNKYIQNILFVFKWEITFEDDSRTHDMWGINFRGGSNTTMCSVNKVKIIVTNYFMMLFEHGHIFTWF